MAFNTAEGRAEYTASSAQTEFTFTFKIYTTSDIKVYQTPSGDTPNDTTDILTLTTDYTVSINGDNGGTVTLNTGAGVGDTIVLVRSLPLTRTTDYQDNGDLLASTLDTDQNYQTYLIIDTYKQIERTLSLPDSTVGVSLELPSPLADGYLKWNADADAIENDTTIPDNVTLSQTAATTATTKASEATTSATNAQLRAWEAEAEKMTADSYATEAEDVFVKTYSSDGDGTFTATNTTEYSALHWAAKSQASAESASGITYDNSISGLTAINVQNAIDEIVAEKAQFESSIIFEGSSADAYETTLTVTNPTADRTITFPDKNMTVAGEDVVIGVGQSWQDVTASRAVGTTYTNSTGKPIIINPMIIQSGSNTSYFSVTINGVITGYSCTFGGGNISSCPLVVPNAGTYSVSINGAGASYYKWMELR